MGPLPAALDNKQEFKMRDLQQQQAKASLGVMSLKSCPSRSDHCEFC